MTICLGVIMDELATIQYETDSTLAMLWEAKRRGWQIAVFTQKELFLQGNVLYGCATIIDVFQNAQCWFTIQHTLVMPLHECALILMRKDPPFDRAYLYTTYLLDYVEKKGVTVINRPQALRDCNEKCFVMHFPTCAPPALLTASIKQLRAFWKTHGDIVCKPLHEKGGREVFHLTPQDDNANVIFDCLTHHESCAIMAQQFIPAIQDGDRRILMINGEPIAHALVRVPPAEDWRGNLAVGAKGIVEPLSKRDRAICKIVGPVLRERGLYFVGLDVIGDYLTEINVTSPTGIRELDQALRSNISAQLFDAILK